MMDTASGFTRREWLGTTAAVCAASFLPATHRSAAAATEVIPAAWVTARSVVQSGELGAVYFAHGAYRSEALAHASMQTALTALLYVTGWRDIYHVRKMGSDVQLLAAAKTHDGGELLISPTLQNEKPVLTIRGDVANLTIRGNRVLVTPELPGKLIVYAKIQGHASRLVPVSANPATATADEMHAIAAARQRMLPA